MANHLNNSAVAVNQNTAAYHCNIFRAASDEITMDERNAIAKARDEWFETNEGKSAMQKFERVFKQSPQTDMFADLGID